MSDSRSAYDEQLPWLEAVDDEDGPRGVSARKMMVALAGRAAAAWRSSQRPCSGSAARIRRASARPADPGRAGTV